jgi:ligand-binding sensor domain-containing protein
MMQLRKLSVAATAAAVVGVLAGAYLLGARNSQRPAPVAMPQGHPQVAASADPQQDYREGKAKLDPARAFTHFRVGEKNVKSIFTEGKVVWVGTSGGVIRYDTGTDDYKLYDARNGLLSNGIFYVGRLQGKIAIGTYGGGLSLLDEKAGTFETYNVPEGLGDAFVYDVLQAKNGDVWIATWSGANRIRGGALKDRSKWDLYTVENTAHGLPNDWVYGLAEGRNGDIWMATEGGLALYRDGKWTNWNHAKGLGADYEIVKKDIAFDNDPSKQSLHHAQQKKEMGLQDVNVAYNPNYIIAMKVDADGVVWTGTWGGGLARYDGKSWKNYTVADGLPGNHVFMLHIDPRGRLWAGTNNGLALMQDGKFIVKTMADGLFAKNVFSMATGADGSQWIGSYGGVAHIRSPLVP